MDSAGTAERLVVAVQDLLVGAGVRCAQGVALAQDGVEVADHEDLLAVCILAQEGHDALTGVVGDDPLEALPAVVDLPEGGMVLVELVQGLDVGLQLGVLVVAQQHPVQRLGLVPLSELAELLTHEQQLLAGVSHHVAKEGAQVCKLGLIVTGHLVDEAALAVDDFVVADGQHEVLAEGVEEAERDLVVVARTEERVSLHVAEHVVHPAHVPLEIEAQAAVGSGFRDHRPRGGLLCDHVLVGVTAQNRIVELAQECHSLKVLLAAVLVGLPLALLPVVVQIEHGSHSVHTQAVDVVLLQPVESAGDEEALHLAAAKVEHHGTPLFVLAALGVRVFIAGFAIEVVQAELVFREVGRHPVHDDADARLMHLVHESHQILRGAVAAGGGEIARHLIAPAAIEGVLHDGQQLHVGVAHLGDIRDELVGQLGVIVGQAALFLLPAAGVHLVDVHRSVDDIGLLLGVLPRLVVPDKAVQIVDLAAVRGAGLCVERIGVSLVDKVARPGGHAIFVNVVFLHARDKQLPHRVIVHLAHRVAARFPAIEIAYYADGRRVRCPDAEHHACLPGPLLDVCAKIAVRFTVIALLEQIHRKIRWIAAGLFLSRFHKQLLPAQAAWAVLCLLLSYIKEFRRIFQEFSCRIYHNLFVDIFLIYTISLILDKKYRQT